MCVGSNRPWPGGSLQTWQAACKAAVGADGAYGKQPIREQAAAAAAGFPPSILESPAPQGALFAAAYDCDSHDDHGGHPIDSVTGMTCKQG